MAPGTEGRKKAVLVGGAVGFRKGVQGAWAPVYSTPNCLWTCGSLPAGCPRKLHPPLAQGQAERPSPKPGGIPV